MEEHAIVALVSKSHKLHRVNKRVGCLKSGRLEEKERKKSVVRSRMLPEKSGLLMDFAA
jgi:hypothetical protein